MIAEVFVALFVAHQVGDHWVQTPRQCARKDLPGWPGRRACAAHVASYIYTSVIALLVLDLATGRQLESPQVIAGLLISAVTHYVVDRRAPLMRMAGWLRKDEDWVRNGGGAYALDQSWHYLWLFVASLVMAA